MSTLAATLASLLVVQPPTTPTPGVPTLPPAPGRADAIRAEGNRAFAGLQEAKTELQGRLIAAEAAKARLREAAEAAEQADAQLRRAAAVVAEREAAVQKLRRELDRYEGERLGTPPVTPPTTPPSPGGTAAADKLDTILKRLVDLDRRLGALEQQKKRGKTDVK